MTTHLNVREAKTQMSRLLKEVEAGAEIVIVRAGKPVARLMPYEPVPRRKRLGLLKGRIRIPANFNAPLPVEVLRGFEGS